MDKPWLKQYPPNTPPEIDLDVYSSIADIFHESVEKYTTLTAYRNMGTSITYGELGRQAAAFGAWCLSEGKLEKGDRIAIMMPNLLQYPIAVFGALSAGLVVVNTNPLYTDRELEHQLSDSGARAIVVVEAFAHTLAAVIDRTEVETVITTKIGDMFPFPKSTIVNFVTRYVRKMVPPFSLPGAVSFRNVLARGAGLTPVRVELDHDDIAFLQYTGGTTGVAKGAMLSHGNLVANVMQATAWICGGSNAPREGGEVIITALPLYHIFALTANCLTFMRLGADNVLITNPRDLPGFVKTLKRTRFTAITGVNTLFNALMHTDGFTDIDFSHIKLVLGGGMAVQESVAARWKEITGSTLVEAYGLTETSPAACMNPPDLPEFNGSIGLPISSTDASIRDENNQALGFNEPGELCIRGPQVMKGYWQRPEETAGTIDAEGWLHTGDVAEMDEQGFVRIVDRLKDMILVSGFNVYPNEVESVIAAMPGVLEVGAIGVPDEYSGEAVKVIVVKKDPALTEEDIKAWCKEELTGYKRPRIIQFADELPKTNVGKILRRELRDV